jgi:hypothetical protein
MCPSVVTYNERTNPKETPCVVSYYNERKGSTKAAITVATKAKAGTPYPEVHGRASVNPQMGLNQLRE